MRPAGEACVSVQLTALVVWVLKTATSKRIDLTRYRVELFLDQAAPLRAGSGAPAPSHPERSDDLIGSRHRNSSADRRVS